MPNVNCAVPGCVSSTRRNMFIKFYRLPKDEKRRKLWYKLIRNDALKTSSKWTSVCHLHFAKGSNDPEIFPWSRSWETVVKGYNKEEELWFVRQQGVSSDHLYAKPSKPLPVQKPPSAIKPLPVRKTRNSRRQYVTPLQEHNENVGCNFPSNQLPITEVPSDEQPHVQAQSPQRSIPCTISVAPVDLDTVGTNGELDTYEDMTMEGKRSENCPNLVMCDTTGDTQNVIMECDRAENCPAVSPTPQPSTSLTRPKMKPYYGSTHLLVQDELQHLLDLITFSLDNNEYTEPKHLQKLLRTVIRLLKNTKEMYDTLHEKQKFDRFLMRRFEGSDKDIRFWTGFYSYEAFMAFYRNIMEPNMRRVKYWGSENATAEKDPAEKCGPKRRLLPIDEVFMTLVKLKQGSANGDLAERFRMDETNVSRIFISIVTLMHDCLTKINIWLSKRKNKKYMPACFLPMYKDVRVVIDCTELRMERPSDFEVQGVTYSSYKGCNTLKSLVGISPSGIPVYVSELFEGSISDNAITMQCTDFVDKLEPGDAVMSDRGWTCKGFFAKRGVRIITPHFLGGRKQMPIPELVESVSLARVRIHVERCMGRIKQWHFLTNRIPLTYWKSVGKIFKTCAYLVLFWPPLLDEEV